VPAIRFSVLANTTVLLTAVIYAIFLRMALAAGLFGILLGVMTMLSLWRYGYAVLRHTASGWENFPPPDIESMNPVGAMSTALHPALFSTAVYFLGTTPFIEGASRWILLAAVLAVFPASAAIMAMTRNVVAALNPAAVASFVRDLGGDYVKLLGVSALLGVFLGLTSEFARASWFLGVFGSMLAVWTVLAKRARRGAGMPTGRRLSISRTARRAVDSSCRRIALSRS
jgi:hypothetical protein